ncbi:hypothetical protein [Paenibacillus prosopidis]|uniref:Uncharacterized protein n=1 Tax=Paenibacillus prosopidis TaxID=630520 RepID=A0A368VKD2_9BACL|nr:hypothetical protein [Paenibacillus prosopidis]RCW41266.1 hypothetical protein DFP97_1255 [Paenibacillus prosopidis]
MDIITSNIYSEVNSFFSVSHKVDLKIREKLNESLKSDLQQALNDEAMPFFNLIVSTSKATINVEVKGPDYNQKEKIINWGLWLPYEAIVNHPKQNIPYISYYFDALVLVFNTYGFPEERMRKIQKSVESEVIGNSQYDFEEETIDLDLSDLELD